MVDGQKGDGRCLVGKGPLKPPKWACLHTNVDYGGMGVGIRFWPKSKKSPEIFFGLSRKKAPLAQVELRAPSPI